MRNLAIDGSFHYLDKSEASPTGFLGTFSALYSGCVEAGGTIFMILCCCACFRIRSRPAHSTPVSAQSCEKWAKRQWPWWS